MRKNFLLIFQDLKKLKGYLMDTDIAMHFLVKHDLQPSFLADDTFEAEDKVLKKYLYRSFSK